MAENDGYVKDEQVVDPETACEDADDQTNDGDITVTIGSPGPYAGMPKEVLLEYSRQRGYVLARDILTAIVVLTILVLLSLVIAIMVISPACLEFWQTSPIYEIYPKSYRASDDANGYGDIKGIIEKLGYLGELGVQIVSVNSLYESSQISNDYEISDFRNIDPIFGSMADMQNLIVSVHNEGMKIMVDFIPNHSSSLHPWFLASSNTSHPDHSKYRDYYVWVGGSENDPPNTWMSDDGMGSAWTWNADRQQFYYHAFSARQPDLNLRNTAVRNELKNILRFWLEKGVDGFRAVGTAYMLEAPHLRDNPLINSSLPASKDNLYPDFTVHYKGNHDIVSEWRAILDEYSTEPGVFRFLEIRDEGSQNTLARYYGTEFRSEASFPRNNVLLGATASEWNAQNLADAIVTWMKIVPEGRWPSWTIGDQDYSRVASRIGAGKSLLGAVLHMTLPGTPTIYYGDEIGMENAPGDLPDSARATMMWGAGESKGFCENCTAWTASAWRESVSKTAEEQNEDTDSTLSHYKALIATRNDMIFQRGHFCMIGNISDTLVYVRELRGLESTLVLLNFGKEESTVDLTASHSSVSGHGTVSLRFGSGHTLNVGDSIDLRQIAVPPLAGFILRADTGDELLSESDAMSGKCFVHSKLCYNAGLQVLEYC